MIEVIGEDIWKVAGSAPGPTIVVFGGVHGNELTGIEVVKKMYGAIESDRLSIDRGTLYLIFGNPKAIARNTRGSEDHKDLNRCFKPSVLDVMNDSYEHERARLLAPILKSADVSLDLHATNKPSVPFLCCVADSAHEKIYQWFDCDRVLADPKFLLGGEPVTTDEFVDLNGGVGLCYETGFVGDLTRVDAVYENVLNVLKDQGMVSGVLPQPTNLTRLVYELTERINLTEAGFRFADHRGTGSFEEFKQNDVIGFVGDEPFVAQYDGVILFPKIQEHWKLNQPVLFLARIA